MSKKFYIADTHFGHENIIRLDNRPFRSVQEMGEQMINRWNSVVDKGDVVYILGDFLWKTKEIDIINRLHGQKILIKGNHDRVKNKDYQKCFVKIVPYEEVKDGQNKVVLSHYPIIAYNGSFAGRNIHLYGHVHVTDEARLVEKFIKENRSKQMPMRMYNVGCMLPHMDYTPRTLEEILESCEKTIDM